MHRQLPPWRGIMIAWRGRWRASSTFSIRTSSCSAAACPTCQTCRRSSPLVFRHTCSRTTSSRGSSRTCMAIRAACGARPGFGRRRGSRKSKPTPNIARPPPVPSPLPMSKRDPHQRTEITYASACELLEHALSDGLRPRILDALTAHGDFQQSAVALRGAMRSHTFPTGGEPLRLQRIVQSFDTRARRAGLHVLESWDYVAQRFASEITPVLMLDRCALDHMAHERQRAALSVLLDHYFMSVLGLIVARAWDEGDPNENLDRTTTLLRALQGSDSSNCRFVDDVETLLLTSVSHYHPDEHAYELIARRFDVLTGAHRRRMALACAAVLGGHLRWGLRFMYRRDIPSMRD